jgi:hypothetical protein
MLFSHGIVASSRGIPWNTGMVRSVLEPDAANVSDLTYHPRLIITLKWLKNVALMVPSRFLLIS